MLALTRKVGQEIHIGSDIVVKISKVKGCQVVLAIQAPENIKILRKELIA